MNRIVASISLFLSLTCPMAQSAIPDREALIEKYSTLLADPELENLSLVTKQINRLFRVEQLLSESKEINKIERKVLLKYPRMGFMLRNTKCRAIAISAAACGLDPRSKTFHRDMQHEETDAIRHFVFSYLLATLNGADRALVFTAAHEGSPESWNENSLMDLHNNSVGVEAFIGRWMASPGIRYGDRWVLELALQALKENRLAVNRMGGTRCATAAIFEQDPSALLNGLGAYYQQMRKLPACRNMNRVLP